MEDVAGETLGVHSHEHARVRPDFAEDEREVLVLVDVISVAEDAPGAEVGWKAGVGDAVHEPLGLEAMRDELRYGNECESVLLREALELGAPGTRPILAKNLADDSGWTEACEPGEINRGFCMSNALKDTAIARTERRYVSGAPKVGRNRLGIDSDTDRFGAVLSTDAGGDAEPLVSINADGERSPVFVGVVFGLLSELELVGAFTGERETNPSARLPDHEVDQLGRDELRRTNEIAFVLAILIVGDDDHLAGFDVGYCLFDCSELHDSLMLQRKVGQGS
jgi:hypothetical protein